MVHFTLPRNSKVQRGKTWNEPENKETWKEFRVYRWNPDGDENPRLDSYWVDTERCGPMVLDAPHQDQERDRRHADLPPLVPRRASAARAR